MSIKYRSSLILLYLDEWNGKERINLINLNMQELEKLKLLNYKENQEKKKDSRKNKEIKKVSRRRKTQCYNLGTISSRS